MTHALAVSGLTVSARSGVLVQKASFAVERGENLTILGETGSGKSLLSQAIMGTLPQGLTSTGAITVDGKSTQAGSAERRALWGHTLALLPQEPWQSLDPTMKVRSQVAEGFANLGRTSAKAAAHDALRLLGLSGADEMYPFMLSGGMAQRVALAATRSAGASILIVDEPTKGLDADLRGDVIAVLRGVVDSGGTLLTITHDVEVANALGGQIVVMLEGVIVEQGPATVVLKAPRHEYTRRLLAADPAAWPARPAPRLGRPILKAAGLTKRYGANTLFADLEVEVRAGQRLAIVGSSGSGKTTLGDLLLGLSRAEAGSVTRAPGIQPLQLQKLYQNPHAAFAPRVTLRCSIDDLVARHQLDTKEVVRLMARLRLSPALLDRRPDQVSGGELQRFSMMRILLLSPAFIFADEPTSRLDPITQQETMNLLVEHAAERDCAILLVTHDIHIGANVTSDAVIRIGEKQAARVA